MSWRLKCFRIGGRLTSVHQIAPQDVELHKEIYKGQSYRLHSAQSSGKAMLVKVYEGQYAKEVRVVPDTELIK